MKRSRNMTEARFSELSDDSSLCLTTQEVKEGWHFCDEMDGLLANLNEKDGDCFCHLNKHRSKISL